MSDPHRFDPDDYQRYLDANDPANQPDDEDLGYYLTGAFMPCELCGAIVGVILMSQLIMDNSEKHRAWHRKFTAGLS